MNAQQLADLQLKNTLNQICSQIRTLELALNRTSVMEKPGGFTVGSVIFAKTAGKIDQDNANFFWDDAGNRLGLGTNVPNTRLDIRGTDSSYGAGPHIDLTTDADAHQEFQILAYTHDNVNLSFDAHWNGSNWISSSPGSNFQIRKSGDLLRIYGKSGVTAGSTVAWNELLQITLTGAIKMGGLPPSFTTNYNASLANLGTMALGMSNFGFALIWAGGSPALYAINGTSHTTTEMLDTSAIFTNAAGSASSINVYWSAGNSQYEIENRRGSAIAVRVWLFDSA